MICNKLSQPKRGFEHCMYPKSAARRLLQQIEDLNIEKATNKNGDRANTDGDGSKPMVFQCFPYEIGRRLGKWGQVDGNSGSTGSIWNCWIIDSWWSFGRARRCWKSARLEKCRSSDHLVMLKWQFQTGTWLETDQTISNLVFRLASNLPTWTFEVIGLRDEEWHIQAEPCLWFFLPQDLESLVKLQQDDLRRRCPSW